MIHNIHVMIKVPPFTDNPIFRDDHVGLKHTQNGDIITFTIPSHLLLMAEISGITLTYNKTV